MKKIFFFIAIVILLVVISNLTRSIYDLRKKEDLIVAAQKELAKEKRKNQKLKSDLSYVESQEFIEKEARNKLFLVKPGEQKVLLDKDLIEGKETMDKKEYKPNWQKWWELFF